MAGELQLAHGISGRTLYALVRTATGTVWRDDTHVFEAYQTAHLGSYVTNLTLTEQGVASGYYVGTFPSNVTAPDVYRIEVRDRIGGSAAESDPVVGADGEFLWDGAAVFNEPAVAVTVAGIETIVTAVAGVVTTIPTADQNAAAWGASAVGNGRTRDYFLQGGMNKFTQSVDGLTLTIYATDDTTIIYTGTTTRLGTAVGGVRSETPG